MNSRGKEGSRAIVTFAVNPFLIDKFEQLFRELFAPLTGFAMKYVRDVDDARSIVHDVFVALWEKYQQLPADTNFKSYLYTSVRNRCLNYLRDRRKMVALDGLPDQTVSTEVDPMGTAELEAEVELSLNTMPPKCREAFELSRAEGLKYTEIAERMGISVKTVEAHITKALSILREHVGKFLVMAICFYFLFG